MATNPHATNADLVGVCYDASGNLHFIVHADNDDFSMHEPPGHTTVTIAYAVYAALPSPSIMPGQVSHYDLAKAVMPALQAKNIALATKLQSRIDARDAAAAAEIEAVKAKQAAVDAFIKSLDPKQAADFAALDALTDQEYATAYPAFVATLNADQLVKMEDVAPAVNGK